MTIWAYIKIIGLNLIPSLLIFIGKNDYFFEILKNKEILEKEFNVDGVQFYCFIIGIIWVALITPIQLAKLKNKYKKEAKALEDLTLHNKNIIFKLIKQRYNSLNIPYRTQIFVPKKSFLSFFRKGTVLVAKDIEGLSDLIEANDLEYKITEESVEGIVGQAFQKKYTIYTDFDMSDTNNYYLTPEQKLKKSNIQFCSAVAITVSEKVVAVLVVESEMKIKPTVNIKKAWRDHMADYAAFVEKQLKHKKL